MVYNFADSPSILNQFVAELRDEQIQKDRMRFRQNLLRIAGIMAYEISKHLDYDKKAVETSLGVAKCDFLRNRVVISSILRAGIPMHNGFLEIFDQADNAFLSAFRMHHKDGSFSIKSEYLASPNLDNSVLILTDPMVATGSSVKIAINQFLTMGTPSKIILATIIASTEGIDYLQRVFPNMDIWVGAIDEELTGKSYIVPGLGDAGDLAYGNKT